MTTRHETAGRRRAGRSKGRDPELLRRIYEVMVLTRAVEDRMVAMYRGGDLLGSLYTGHWHEAISVGCGVVPAARRLHGAAAPQPRGPPVEGHGALADHGELHGQGDLAHRRPGRHAALRPAGPGHLQPAQPHPGELPGGHRDGVRREVPRRGPGVPGVLRRRVDLPGRLPRGAVDRERAEAAERLRDREQPVLLLDAAAADVELGDVRGQGGRLRDPGRDGGRHGRAGGARRGRRGGGPGPPRRRARRSSRA